MKSKAISVIGEGITEKFYIESLKGLSAFTIKPQQLGHKASSLKELAAAIKDTIEKGFDEVYCLIDMDGKREGKIKSDYQKLKQQYHKTHIKKNKGISCKVIFVETERCIELWFLYHFLKTATTKKFTSYQQLEKELQKYLPNYQKTEKYFRSIEKLHEELIKKNGTLPQAIENAKTSIETKCRDNREYTYSEMYPLLEALEIK